jgi:hypothetical protein
VEILENIFNLLGLAFNFFFGRPKTRHNLGLVFLHLMPGELLVFLVLWEQTVFSCGYNQFLALCEYKALLALVI